jgi:ABC-type transport system substrate-binding protein/class 3 adenylate cyclase
MTDQRADVGAEPEGEPGRDRGERTTGFRAFLLSDIRGYSSFSAARGDEAAAALTGRFIALAEDVVGRFGGEQLANRGDEVLFAFESPRQAIRAAVAFEQALLEATREDPSLPMPAGVGIDVGEAVVVPDGWRANAINVAARLCSLAKGGEILATREAVHLAQAIDGIGYTPRGATQVKGIAQPVNLVRVVPAGGDAARGFQELGFARAQALPPRRRFGRRALAAGVAAALVVAAGIIVVLASGGSSSVRLAADEIGGIDTGSGLVTSAIPVSAQPTSVAVGRDGSIWVVSAAAGTLSRIDPNTHDVTQITVGSDPVAVGVAPDGSSVWVANSGDGTVSRVSPQNNQVVGPPVRVGAGPSALVATNNAVWVANTLNASVSRIALPNESVKTIPVGSEPAGIAAGDGSIWVADQGDGTVYRLDGHGAESAAPIQVGSGLTGITFGDGAAWVVNTTGLSRIDPQSNSVTTTIPVGKGPYDVAAGPGGVWVSDEYGNSIAHINPATLTVAYTPTSSAPLGLALAGDRLWVATDGGGSAAHRGGVLSVLASGTWFPTGPDVSAFDPGSAYTPLLFRVLVMTSDGLVGYRRSGGVAGNELVPDLAVSLPAPTDNGLTYTFHIRSGIRYSNGVPLRASDFVRGVERAFKLLASPSGGTATDLGSITGAAKCLAHPTSCDLSQGVRADDATNTVTIHLAEPDPDLFAQLTLPAAYPVPPGTPIHLRTRSVPGTGAYEIAYYSPAASNNQHAHGLLILKRNRYFQQWSAAAQPAGFPDRIVVRTNYAPAQQVSAVEQGRVDLAWDPIPQGEATALSQNYASQLHASPYPETTWLWLNVRSAPFNNVLARRAVEYALDRAALGQASEDNFDQGRPTCQMLPPTFPGYVPYCLYTVDPTSSQRWLAPDLVKAQALVHQSGTFGDKVALLTRPADGHRYWHLLARTLSKIGYRVQMHATSDNNYFGQPPRFYAQFQAGVGNWAADYVASSQFFAQLIGCSAITPPGQNMGGFCDHSLDERFATARSNEIINPGLASQQWAAIDRAVADSAPVIPISNHLWWDFVARRVGNYQNNPQWGVLVDQLWVR